MYKYFLCLEQIMYCHRTCVHKHQAGHATMAALRTVIVPLFVKCFRVGVRKGVRTTVRKGVRKCVRNDARKFRCNYTYTFLKIRLFGYF